MNILKELIKKALRLVFTPWRKSYAKRNGTLPTQQRVELPNDAFLGLVSEKLAEGHTTVIWVKGYSMRPFIEFGRDKVKLSRSEEYDIGDAVLAQISPGHYVLHRIIEKDENRVTLQGDGNLSGVERCMTSDICGVVLEYIRPGRTISASDPQLCQGIRIWRKLRPIRRILLLIYKSVL